VSGHLESHALKEWNKIGLGRRYWDENGLTLNIYLENVKKRYHGQINVLVARKYFRIIIQHM